ncbi:MAG TPA: GGDEF domain-containing protein [Thermodesulfobacteriaceae bacterium]|nr:GGDEF domain-containing protein [Thermodesulfobacteriaceae bacterium]
MNGRDVNIPECPEGNDNCCLAAELRRLRAERDRLLELVETDQLTGLYNYRHLIKSLDHEMERTRRTGLPVALAMIDLDFFKRVNDRYGHEAGNKALREVARICKHRIRRIDILCRYGGEEFALILPGTRLEMAVKTAERLRRELRSTPVNLEGRDVIITASFGVGVYRTRDTFSVEEFIRHVDRYLLLAKSRGRNRVCYRESRVDSLGTDLSREERKALLDDKGK